MRLLFYNIRYGTGGRRLLFPWSGYWQNTGGNLGRIAGFLQSAEADVIGLVEVDLGSYRSGRRNQAETLAERLGHYHTYRSKYGERALLQSLPVLNKQGNAFLTRDTVHARRFHYFRRGVKRLVLELELENLVLFLVHLPLGFRARHQHLGALYRLLREQTKPCVVAGDFNALWGEEEIDLFLAATGLVNANAGGEPSFPSWAPRRHLDFILHSPTVRVERFWMPPVTYSDHLPLICDIRLDP
jgi:endonuclease/exonuclease/phosphatase family metal-dependent hydrolase